MTKKINTSAIANELKESSFFHPKKSTQVSPTRQVPIGAPKTEVKEHELSNDTMVPRHHEATEPNEDILEVVRRAVKQIGKEAATHRFTLAEKNALADIEYTYKRTGVRTSENEIARIAINYFIEDYKKDGEQSILAKILTRINS